MCEGHPADDFDRSDLWAIDPASARRGGFAERPGAATTARRWIPGAPRGLCLGTRRLGRVVPGGPRRLGSAPLTAAGADFSEPAWRPDGRALAAVRTRAGCADLVLVDAADGTVTLVAPGGVWSRPQWAEGGTLVATHEDHRTPPRLVRVDPDGRWSPCWTGCPPRWPPPPTSPPSESPTARPTARPSRASCSSRPPPPRQRVPAVVYPHGGPTAYYGDEWDGHAQYFIDKGYAWFAINFRGSTSYGRAFERANRGVWGVADTADCLAAADSWPASTGWTRGAWRSSAPPTGPTWRWPRWPSTRSTASPAGWPSTATATSPPLGPRGSGSGGRTWSSMMGRPASPGGLRAGSPLHRVADITRPLLVAHGEGDTRVHPGQSAQLVEALRREARPSSTSPIPPKATGCCAGNRNCTSTAGWSGSWTGT